ncbi:MAG: BlaI/MecI/CopY family transcriptional regulator [Bacteroidaceae bacterium]|nr:BlaI/MecI/CopY family transcriptional regulator [Bacteroidaceae bacterium]
MKELTEKEMELMGILWDEPEGLTMRELYDKMPEPRTHFNTVSTFIRRLEEDGFVSHHAIAGRLFRYFAKITRLEYEKKEQKSFINRFFNGSSFDFVKHLVKEEEINKEELEELLNLIKK